MRSATASQAGSHRARSAAPSDRSSATRKDAEIANLKKQLESYELDDHHSKHRRSFSASRREYSQSPSKVSRKPSSKAWESDMLDGRIEKGQISRKSKDHSDSPKHASMIGKGAAGLVALDARLEKGGISTRRRDKAFDEVEAVEARKYRRDSNALSSEITLQKSARHGRSPARSTHRRRSPSRVLEADRSRKYSAAASSSALSFGTSPPRSIASHGRSLKGGSVRRSSLGPSSASSASGTIKGSSLRRSSLSRSRSSSETSLDKASEHGGSVALLHQRQRYNRSCSRGRVPEIPPLERRPEIVGGGFRPHRSPVEKEVGIVEVFEETSRGAPRARQIGRRHEYERERRAREYRGVVEIGSERGGRTLYKVN